MRVPLWSTAPMAPTFDPAGCPKVLLPEVLVT
jgi:hypothetical protein